MCLDVPGVVDDVTTSILLRVAAAVPARPIRIVDADAAAMFAAALGLPSPTTNRTEEIAALALQLDLLDMQASAGESVELPKDLPGLVVIGSAGQRPDAERADIERLVMLCWRFDVPVIFILDARELAATAGRLEPVVVPAVPAVVTDGWTGLEWEFTPVEPAPESARAAVTQRVR